MSSDNPKLDRYSRQIFFPGIGEDGQAKILASHVLVLGCGALGTVSASSLARAGVGHLHIVDRDFIEENNLQRQILFDEDDIAAGLPKAEAARRKLVRINSTITVDATVADVNYTNIESLITDVDVVIDASDNFETRFLLNDACIKHGVPWIYGACVGSTGLTMNILPKETPCFRCVFESAPPPELNPSCDTAGVLNGIVNIVSSLQTVEALKLLAGRKDEMSRSLVSIDVWEGSFRRLELGDGPLPECPTCGQERFEYLGAQWGSHATSLCGRNSVQITRKDGLTLDFEGLERKLGTLASVTRNRFMLKFECEGYGFTIFPDGRAIIQGTHDPTLARNLYAKYIGA